MGRLSRAGSPGESLEISQVVAPRADIAVINVFGHAPRGRLGALELPSPRRPLPSRHLPGSGPARPPHRLRPGWTALALRFVSTPRVHAALHDIAVCLLVGVAVIAVLVFTTGCTTASGPDAVFTETKDRNSALVQISNLSPCTWEITFADPSHQPATQVRVGAREVLDLALPPGDYHVTQTALQGLPTATATTRFELQVAAHTTYRWALATLLTGPTGTTP